MFHIQPFVLLGYTPLLPRHTGVLRIHNLSTATRGGGLAGSPARRPQRNPEISNPEPLVITHGKFPISNSRPQTLNLKPRSRWSRRMTRATRMCRSLPPPGHSRYTIHPSHYTLHTSHYTLYTTLYTLHATHHTLDATHYTLYAAY